MTLPTPPSTRLLGKSGIEISSIAWGMWRFAGQSEAEAAKPLKGKSPAPTNITTDNVLK